MEDREARKKKANIEGNIQAIKSNAIGKKKKSGPSQRQNQGKQDLS